MIMFLINNFYQLFVFLLSFPIRLKSFLSINISIFFRHLLLVFRDFLSILKARFFNYHNLFNLILSPDIAILLRLMELAL